MAKLIFERKAHAEFKLMKLNFG